MNFIIFLLIVFQWWLGGQAGHQSPCENTYYKHTLHLGGSHPIEVFGKGRRGVPTAREQTRMYGETKHKHLGLPILHVKTY